MHSFDLLLKCRFFFKSLFLNPQKQPSSRIQLNHNLRCKRCTNFRELSLTFETSNLRSGIMNQSKWVFSRNYSRDRKTFYLNYSQYYHKLIVGEKICFLNLLGVSLICNRLSDIHSDSNEFLTDSPILIISISNRYWAILWK